MIENIYKIWCVEIGNFVEIQDLDTGKSGFCQLVDEVEASTSLPEIKQLSRVVQPSTDAGQVRVDSRLGRLLIKKKVGDIVELIDGDVIKKFKILRILS